MMTEEQCDRQRARAYKIAGVLEGIAHGLRNGSYIGGYGHFHEWGVWERLVKELPDSAGLIANAASESVQKPA